MILPDDTCAVTANRFQCRLVPNEKLVNTAGHTPGTSAVESINGDALKLNKRNSSIRLRTKLPKPARYRGKPNQP